MNDDGRVASGTIIVGAVLGVLCCAVPLLGALLLSDLAVLFASGSQLLTLVLVGLVAVVGMLLLRSVARERRPSSMRGEAAGVDDCCSPADTSQKKLTR